MTNDIRGRIYAKMSELRPGDEVEVDDGFDGCFIPWSKRTVVEVNGELALIHNAPECGACGGDNEAGDCHHYLAPQIDDDDGDSLIGIYPISLHVNSFVPHHARGARAWLQLTQSEVALRSEVALSTYKRFEADLPITRANKSMIERFFRNQGFDFTTTSIMRKNSP